MRHRILNLHKVQQWEIQSPAPGKEQPYVPSTCWGQLCWKTPWHISAWGFWWTPWTRGKKMKETEQPETLFHCVRVDWALAQVAKRGCWVSIFADTQKPSGQGPGQPALSDHLRAEELYHTTTLQRFLPISTPLWFWKRSSTISICVLQSPRKDFLYSKWSESQFLCGRLQACTHACTYTHRYPYSFERTENQYLMFLSPQEFHIPGLCKKIPSLKSHGESTTHGQFLRGAKDTVLLELRMSEYSIKLIKVLPAVKKKCLASKKEKRKSSKATKVLPGILPAFKWHPDLTEMHQLTWALKQPLKSWTVCKVH